MFTVSMEKTEFLQFVEILAEETAGAKTWRGEYGYLGNRRGLL